MNRACLGLSVSLLSTLILAAPAATAQPAPSQPEADPFAEADRLEREALASWDAERPAEALPLLERAVLGAHRPRTLAQLGLLEARLGRWVRAEEHVVEALDAPDAWVRENRERIERALERIRSRVASLEIECDQAGATVWIGNEQVATLPRARPLRIPVGTTPVEVRAPGFRTVVRQVTADAGTTAHERVSLIADAPAAPVVALPVAAPVVAPVAPPPQGASTGRVVAWVSIGAGALSLVGGVVALGYGLAASSDFDDAANNCRPMPGTMPGVNCGDLQTTSEDATVAAGVLLGSAALFGGVAAVLFATSGPSPRSATALRCGPGPGTAGVSCGMAF